MALPIEDLTPTQEGQIRGFLGLGNAATKDVGTTAGTVAAGDAAAAAASAASSAATAAAAASTAAAAASTAAATAQSTADAKYSRPGSGIPASDLAAAVQTALSDSREWTAATVDQAEAEAGTAATRRAWTAQRVWQAIAAWWASVSTAAGRAIVTAADAAAQRTAMGAAASGAITGSGLTQATARLLGRTTAGTGAVEEISVGAGLSLAGGVLSSPGGGAGTKTLAVFTPMTSQPPATAFATLDTRNSIAVLDFDDAAVESATWVGIIPEAANLGDGLLVRIHWTATSATTGNVRWRIAFEDLIGSDIDADSFDTAAEGTGAANATSGIPTATAISITTIDGLAAGDAYRLRVSRVGTDGTNDTMSGDAEILSVEVRSIA